MNPIRHEWFPYWAVRQLQAYSTKPLKVLKQVGPNVYLNDDPTNCKNSSIFNVGNLVTYKGSTVYHLPHDLVKTPMTHPTPPNILPTRKENIDAILDY